jgi:hypothetical protein
VVCSKGSSRDWSIPSSHLNGREIQCISVSEREYLNISHDGDTGKAGDKRNTYPVNASEYIGR